MRRGIERSAGGAHALAGSKGEVRFSRVAVLVTAFKRLASGRTLPVHGLFRNIHAAGLAFRPDDVRSPVSGAITIELASFTTDVQERDANVVEHLFRQLRDVSATIEPDGQILTAEGDDAWSWRGFVRLSFGARLPIVLELRRRRLPDRTELSARLARPIDTSITGLGLPFAAFTETLGLDAVVDRIEVDAGIVLDEEATAPRLRVVIAGGGIAGLSAAQTLADAGCDVTILEKERACGGKLGSHVDESLGHTVEHGIHGIFPAYRNLVALWEDVGIGESVFADTSTVGLASPDGITAGHFHELSGQAPMFLRDMVPGGLLRARDLAASAAFLARVYATSSDRDLLDRETFQALLDRYGVSARVQRFVMHPYVRNLSYARPDQVSAAAACDALGYYLLEDAGNFKARWLDGGPQELVIEPWIAELVKRGVRLLTSSPVKFVVFEDGRFHGFATRAVIPSRTLGTRERCWTQRFGSRVVALRWIPEREELCAWDGLCTHAGCPLQPAGDHGRDGFRCACHGGAFDVEGRVVRAPPTRDLPSLPVVREEISGDVFWKISLEESDVGDGVLAADYGIVALDIEGARRVLPPALLDLPSTRGISKLRTTPLMVLRMWFHGKDYSGPDSGFFQADDLLDNFFVLSRFQREFREVENHTIVECHIGDCATIEGRDDEHVLVEAARCLARYFPELGPANLDTERSRVLRHHEGFTLFSPGDAERIPSVAAADRPNLMFAGDWVRSETRSWYMERAAVTGIEAANHVLAQQGLGGRSVLPAPAQYDDVVPKLISLPVRAGDILRQVYRAVVDGKERAPSDDTPAPAPPPKAPEREAAAPRHRSVHRSSGRRLVSAKPHVETRPLIDLGELLSSADLARVHPHVRAFYENPVAFDVVARLQMTPLVEQILRGGVPVSPLYALGLLGGHESKQQREYPVTMSVRRGAHDGVRWDRFLSVDGIQVPLFTGTVAVVDGHLREALDGHGTPITIDLRARVEGDGVRFDLVRATPSLLFAGARIAYVTMPTPGGIRTAGTYRHRFLRVDGRLELEGTTRELDDRGVLDEPSTPARERTR